MANLIKKYSCTNFGNCETANKKVLLEIADGEDLVCPVCKKRMLVPVKKKLSLPIFIICVILLLGVLSGVVILLTRNNSSLEKISLNQSTTNFLVGDTDKLNVTTIPDGIDAKYLWSSSDEAVAKVSDGLVSMIGAGEATITVTTEQNPEILATCTYTVEEKPSFVPEGEEKIDAGNSENDKQGDPVPPPSVNKSGKLDLGYATYNGEIKNGKANGQGTLVFKRAYRISEDDPKERIAQPGDRITGTFENNKVTTARWFGKDGTLKESIIIGSTGVQ